MSESIVQIRELTRCFGSKTALASVNLSLTRGRIHGLVGVNGAGKTTLIKHVLGLLRAEKGSVKVFGLDPVEDPVGVLARTGYLSEENDLPGWMRVDELIRYSRAFYPTWDDCYAEELRKTFDLDPTAKISNLSKGQKARVGLLIALSFRPELLLLDEPSSGLDPIVRRDILGAVIRTVADEGRTVLFSSHLLGELEQVADHVSMISQGSIVLSEPLDDIQKSHRSITVHFPQPRTHFPTVAGVLLWEGEGREWKAVVHHGFNEFQAAVAGWGASVVAEEEPTLEEIFVAHVGTSASPAKEA